MNTPRIYPDGRLDVENASLYTGYAVKTLAQLRYQGRGPRFVKPTGGRVFYYQADLDEWIQRDGRHISSTQARFVSHNHNLKGQ